MEDLSLHILDVVENSIRAKAENVKIKLCENTPEDLFMLEISDDGEGMDDSTKRRCMDPFYTTKHGKDTGLGLSLLAQSFEEAGGKLVVRTEKGKGTSVTATCRMSHIDRRPLGDIDGTLRCLRATHPEINFSYEFVKINNG